ncbi:TPA: MFS transporter [Candidatus Saccharibacteria bacterium]|nr:MFS transporter [Candidatus Saccharibacteria bacterium]HRK40735.1 MFS transporter [Candidatus Saccharibacteria bacterium]
MKKWSVIIILAVSQFVMILDSTVMNVSISSVAADLGTSISGMQAAITLYALTMAAFMLTGGKLGDRWGRKRAFLIGSIVYGIGSLITALSPNLTTLLFGWSLVEGLGAVLVIPAIAALTAANYKGKDRIVAFSIIGAATGIAAAAGPLIGGLVTTYFSWRYVFAAETLIMIAVLLLSGSIRDERTSKKVSIDLQSSALSAGGMALLVFGVLQSKTWGWISPVTVPVINGWEVAPFGVSLVFYLIIAGVFLLWLFVRRQKSLVAQGKTPLLRISIFTIAPLRSALSVLTSQYFTIAALFFVIPVYLQTILGYDALQTGIKLVPLSIGLVIFSALGSKLSSTIPARRITRFGQIAMTLGVFFVFASIQPELHSSFFWIGMFVIGAGFGLLASQLGNILMSSVDKKDTAVVGGLQGTFQNFGTSLGTAVVGSVFMLTLASGFGAAVQANTDLSNETKTQVAAKASTGIEIVSEEQAKQIVQDNGGSAATAETVSTVYEASQLQALREAMAIVLGISIISLLLSRNLPAKLT